MSLSRFPLLPCFLLLAVLSITAWPSLADEKPDRPNVLFLITDDQSFDTIAALGIPAIRTPHLDRLVGSGLTFRNAYIMGGSSPAVCSPSRACLFSGRILWNLEIQGMWGFEISGKYRTLPQVFRENGYTPFPFTDRQGKEFWSTYEAEQE